MTLWLLWCVMTRERRNRRNGMGNETRNRHTRQTNKKKKLTQSSIVRRKGRSQGQSSMRPGAWIFRLFLDCPNTFIRLWHTITKKEKERKQYIFTVIEHWWCYHKDAAALNICTSTCWLSRCSKRSDTGGRALRECKSCEAKHSNAILAQLRRSFCTRPTPPKYDQEWKMLSGDGEKRKAFMASQRHKM